MEVHGKDPKKVVGLTVTLQEVNLFTTGLFGCEASAEESFHTALVRKQMTVLGENSKNLFSIFRIFIFTTLLKYRDDLNTNAFRFQSGTLKVEIHRIGLYIGSHFRLKGNRPADIKRKQN